MPPRVCAAECTNGREESAVDSTAADWTDVKLFRERHFGGADDDGLATEGEDTGSEHRRCRCRREAER